MTKYWRGHYVNKLLEACIYGIPLSPGFGTYACATEVMYFSEFVGSSKS